MRERYVWMPLTGKKIFSIKTWYLSTSCQTLLHGASAQRTQSLGLCTSDPALEVGGRPSSRLLLRFPRSQRWLQSKPTLARSYSCGWQEHKNCISWQIRKHFSFCTGVKMKLLRILQIRYLRTVNSSGWDMGASSSTARTWASPSHILKELAEG